MADAVEDQLARMAALILLLRDFQPQVVVEHSAERIEDHNIWPIVHAMANAIAECRAQLAGLAVWADLEHVERTEREGRTDGP